VREENKDIAVPDVVVTVDVSPEVNVRRPRFGLSVRFGRGEESDRQGAKAENEGEETDAKGAH
jgi:hypothetical protein